VYAAQLAGLIEEESKEEEDETVMENEDEETQDRTAEDVNADADADAMDVDTQSASASTSTKRRRSARTRPNPAWTLDIPLGTDEEAERWRNGDMAEVYENALRTLQRLQGEGDSEVGKEAGSEGNALATTVGKAERAGRAAEVVESM
jgi:kinetochor protein Mis14/NSL1